MKGLLFFLYFLISIPLFAQQKNDIQTVTARANTLYNAKKWSELTKLGSKAIEKGIETGGLYFQVGVAHFNLKEYFSAKKYFETYLKKYDSGNALAHEYLYWCHIYTGNPTEARFGIRKAADFVKKTQSEQRFRPLDFVYLEGGSKQSSRPDSMTALPFYSLCLGQKLGHRVSLVYQIGSVEQRKYLKRDINQTEFVAKINVRTWQGASVWASGHFNNAKVYTKDSVFPTPQYRSIYTVNTSQQSQALLLGLRQSYQRINAQIYVARVTVPTNIFVQGNETFLPTGANGNFTDTTNIKENYWQFGGDIESILPFWQNRIAVNIGGFVQTDTANIARNSLKIGVSAQVLARLNISANYTQQSNLRNFVELDGFLFNNAANSSNGRFGLMATGFLSKKITAYAGWQTEKKAEQYFDFKYNTVFLGLKLRI